MGASMLTAPSAEQSRAVLPVSACRPPRLVQQLVEQCAAGARQGLAATRLRGNPGVWRPGLAPPDSLFPSCPLPFLPSFAVPMLRPYLRGLPGAAAKDTQQPPPLLLLAAPPSPGQHGPPSPEPRAQGLSGLPRVQESAAAEAPPAPQAGRSLWEDARAVEAAALAATGRACSTAVRASARVRLGERGPSSLDGGGWNGLRAGGRSRPLCSFCRHSCGRLTLAAELDLQV